MNMGQLWTKEQLLKEVKDSHPLLKSVAFAYEPDWTTVEIPDEADHWNICFTIIDPDDSIANQIVESNLIMFATVVKADHWKERINLVQCNICWQLTGPHKACMLSRTRKLLNCITRVCQEIRDIKKGRLFKPSRNLLGTDRRNTERLPD